MTHELLQQVQTLQFTDRQQAEELLLWFIREITPYDAVGVELRPLAVSLNSFNGYLTLANGSKLFFKSHTESDTVIDEYYHSATLANAGYPVIQPIYSSTEPGKQILIYDLIESPSVFDVAWGIETGQGDSEVSLGDLAAVQYAADDDLFQLYQHTLNSQTAQEANNAAIHQLFYYRLAGGRLERFYGALPDTSGMAVPIQISGKSYDMRQVRNVHWNINGQEYRESLDDIIQRAIHILNPQQAGPCVVGHGDAHNGNVFLVNTELQSPSMLYFDPAFAGQHHPLLDIAKPLFHNVFAMWMYFPHEKRRKLAISLQIDGDVWRVTHSYALHPVRWMFLRSKIQRVLIPTLRLLQEQQMLRADWREYLKAALFCCPFLTLNLADSTRFPPEISLLGLCMAVSMGSESYGKRSVIDRLLDLVEKAL